MLIHIWGDYGLFSRPELASNRVSYPVPPWSAVTGILEAIFWKRGCIWRVDRVYVLRRIEYIPIMLNERQISNKTTQRTSLFLKKPEYVVDATPTGVEPRKYQDMASKFVEIGRSRRRIFLGTKECAAFFGPPPCDFTDRAARANRGRSGDLGNMPLRIMYREDGHPLGEEWSPYVFNGEGGFYHTGEATS